MTKITDEARIHELEQMVNDSEAAHQDTALRLQEAEARLAKAVEIFDCIKRVPGIECIPDSEIQTNIRTFLQSLGKEG